MQETTWGCEKMELHTIKGKIISFNHVATEPVLVLCTVIKEDEIKQLLGSLKQIKPIFSEVL